MYIGEPTLRQKAKLIIQSLRLGADADGDQSTTRTPKPVPRPPLPSIRLATIPIHTPPPIRFVTRPTPTIPTLRPVTPFPSLAFKTCPDGRRIRADQTCLHVPYTAPTTPRFRIFTTSRFSIVTTSPPFNTRPPFRGKRQTSSINYCPTAQEQVNNRICPNMCPKGNHKINKL